MVKQKRASVLTALTMDNQQGSRSHMLICTQGILFWQSQLDNIKELYYDRKMSTIQIAKIYGVNPSTITSNMKKLGLPLRKIGESERPNAKYQVDSSYFLNIDTPEKAYVLGFILSDGHISKKNKLMFAVHEKDADIIYKIRRELNSTHPIKNIRGKYIGMIITSKLLCDSLRNLGLTNHKTFDFNAGRLFSSVVDVYKPDFIRGIFDGDGSICIYKYPYFKKHSFHFGITGLKVTLDYVNNELHLPTKYADEGNGIYTQVSSCRKDIQSIGHYLYDNATLYLDRKKMIFDKAMSLIENNE